jgi:hypothetical protein
MVRRSLHRRRNLRRFTSHGSRLQAFVDRLVRGASIKGRLTRSLLARGGWDPFVQVFTEAHCAGHQCWHLHDTGHPGHDGQLAAAVGDPLLRVYQAVDTAIGEIVEEAGAATVVLVAAHGMAYQYGAQVLLPEILFRLDAAARPLETEAQPGRGRVLARRAWHALPAWARSCSTLRCVASSSPPPGELPRM